MENVFRSGSERRVFSFAQVAAITQLPEQEVELVLMRAMSLGLLKGSIDEYDKTVAINWVQPRFLEMSQVCKISQVLFFIISS
jgi:26S proteasome regulatory subunit N9